MDGLRMISRNSHINLDWVAAYGCMVIVVGSCFEVPGTIETMYLMKKCHEYVEMSEGVAEPSPKTLDLLWLVNA